MSRHRPRTTNRPVPVSIPPVIYLVKEQQNLPVPPPSSISYAPVENEQISIPLELKIPDKTKKRGRCGPKGQQGNPGPRGPPGPPGDPAIVTSNCCTLDLLQANNNIVDTPPGNFIGSYVIGNVLHLWGTTQYINGNSSAGDIQNFPFFYVIINRNAVGLANTAQNVNQTCSVGLYTLTAAVSTDDENSQQTITISGRVVINYFDVNEMVLIFEQSVCNTQPFYNDYTFDSLCSYTFNADCMLSTDPDLLFYNVLDGVNTVFTEIQSNSNGAFANDPANPVIAAGFTEIIVMTNSFIAIYDKVLTCSSLPIVKSLFDFWRQAVNFPLGNDPTVIVNYNVSIYGFIFDPWILFDRQKKRYIVTAVRRYYGQGGYLLLAVSTSASPTDLSTNNWYFYQFNRSPDGTTYPDYTKVGYDDTAYYFSENNLMMAGYTISNSDTFVNNKLYAVLKSDVINGKPSPQLYDIPIMTLEPSPTCPNGDPFTSFVAPVQIYDHSNTMYFIISYPGGIYPDLQHPATIITLVAVQNITNLGGPTVFSIDLTVNPYNNPFSIIQNTAGNPPTLCPDSTRFSTGILSNGHLWATHHIIDTNLTVVRWYDIKLNRWPNGNNVPVVMQQDELVSESSEAQTFYPSINVDKYNNMAIQSNAIGNVAAPSSYSDVNPSIVFTGRLFKDTLSQTRDLSFAKVSILPYDNGSGQQQQNWGYYSGLALDQDGTTFWLHNTFATPNPYTAVAGGPGMWQTFIMKFSINNSAQPV